MNLNKLIADTGKFLTNDSIGKNGLIRKVYFFDKKQWYEFYKPDDFGDHTPFAAKTVGIGFAKKQYSIWKSRMLNGIPIPIHKIPLPPFLEIRNSDDFLHGLIVLAYMDKYFIKEAEEFSMNIIKVLQMKNGMFASVSLPFVHLKLPEGASPLKPTLKNLSFASASSNGVICEKMIILGSISKNNKLVLEAKKCLDAWLNTKMFAVHGVFPDNAIPESKNSLLMKTNSNMGFALIESARQGDKTHKKAIGKLLSRVGGLYKLKIGYANNLDTESGKVGKFSLIATQAYCRLLIEASAFNKEFRTKATKIAFDIARKVFLTRELAYSAFESDGSGDFGIMLMILDTKRKNKEMMKNIYHFMTQNFYLGNGIWRDYSKKEMQKTTHSKYLGGVLKYLLCYRAYLNNQNLENINWRYLLQDR